MNNLFIPGDILLPKNVDMGLWSVIACDQFTSRPEYWDDLDKRVGERPSTLRLMLPEAYLESRDVVRETEKINASMKKYLEEGVFETVEDSYIYVERDMTSGEKRRGILGLIDLEAYDYSASSGSLVRPTEGTVESRLPSRVKVREKAALEMPHIVVFVDDPEWTMFNDLNSCEELYDFELMDGGGHIVGRRVCGKHAETVQAALEKLSDADYLGNRYELNGKPPVVIAMGDGNHSLATAKKCWEDIKQSLTERELENHPARYSMVELVNIHDKSVAFEPIHRVMFETGTQSFFAEAEGYLNSAGGGQSGSHKIKLLCGSEIREIAISGKTIGSIVALAQEFCTGYIDRHGGRLDYIHDDAAAVSLSAGKGCCGLLLPPLDKNELFSSIIESGAFPAKSFSIGPARDKRYYLECRRIK